MVFLSWEGCVQSSGPAMVAKTMLGALPWRGKSSEKKRREEREREPQNLNPTPLNP